MRSPVIPIAVWSRPACHTRPKALLMLQKMALSKSPMPDKMYYIDMLIDDSEVSWSEAGLIWCKILLSRRWLNKCLNISVSFSICNVFFVSKGNHFTSLIYVAQQRNMWQVGDYKEVTTFVNWIDTSFLKAWYFTIFKRFIKEWAKREG